MSGFVGDLSPEQEKALSEFKIRCADVWEEQFDDYFALKWLRARGFSLDKSEIMLRNHLTYRAKIDLDNMLKWYKGSEVLEKFAAGGITGFDHSGNPVWVVPAGDYDLRGVLECVTIRELSLYLIYLVERSNEVMRQQTKKLNRRIDKRVFVIDMTNFSMKQILPKNVRRLIGRSVFLYESNYPESLEKAFIVNAPSFFPLCWKLLRPLLSDQTASKVHIFGKDGWKEEVFKTIDPNQIPVYYGGTLVGPSGCPKCSELIPEGGIVPEKYYRKNQSLNGENVRTTKVLKRSSHDIELEVTSAGLVINWAFRTDGHDLAFSISRKNSDNSTKEVVALTRVNCHLLPEEGFYNCEEAGTYIFKLDNSFSWFTDKTVTFDINVSQPIDDLEKKSSTEFIEKPLSQRA